MSYYLAKQDYLTHHGILGQKWGIRRYQNPDGTYTEAGRRRRAKEYLLSSSKKQKDWRNVNDIRERVLTDDQKKKLNKLAYEYATEVRSAKYDTYLKEKYANKKSAWYNEASDKELAEIFRSEKAIEDKKQKLDDYSFSIVKDFLSDHGKKNIYEIHNPIVNLTEQLSNQSVFYEGDRDYYRKRSAEANLKKAKELHKEALRLKDIDPKITKLEVDLAQMEYDEVLEYLKKKYD